MASLFTKNNPCIGFIGAGNMAQSLIGGLLQNGFEPSHFLVSDPSSACQHAARALGVGICADNDELASRVDIVVLAVKPQLAREVITPLANVIQAKRPLLISIAAGISCRSLVSWGGGDFPIVRCMPNTPALVQAGATGLYANGSVSNEQKQAAEQIMQAVGVALWVENESDIDAVTAISGSGPAYFFLLMELMQEAGKKLGLDEKSVEQLTQQTALGAAKMAADSDVDFAELRRRVTSPNGTTHAAIQSFQQSGLAAVVEQALTAAHSRSIELAKEFGKM